MKKITKTLLLASFSAFTSLTTFGQTPVATATPPSQTICAGTATSIALTSTVSGTTYSWTVVQTNVSGAAAGSGAQIVQILTATGASAGTAVYTITPTAGGNVGAPITVTVTVNLCTGIANAFNNSTVTIYPNPSTGVFTVSLQNATANYTVEIYNVLGKKVFEQLQVNAQTSNEINLSGYPKGIYFVKINEGTKMYSSKLVIQ